MNNDGNLVLKVRMAHRNTQTLFAKRLGVSERSLRRYETDGTLPTNKAVLRALRDLARRKNVAFPKQLSSDLDFE